MIQKQAYLIYSIYASSLFGQGFWGNEFPEAKIEYSPRSYVCYKTDVPILIDGKMNDIGGQRLNGHNLLLILKEVLSQIHI